jgi:hypothetical protein
VLPHVFRRPLDLRLNFPSPGVKLLFENLKNDERTGVGVYFALERLRLRRCHVFVFNGKVTKGRELIYTKSGHGPRLLGKHWG